MLWAIESMNDILGSNYHIVTSEGSDPVVLATLPGESLAKKDDNKPKEAQEQHEESFSVEQNKKKTTDDYLFQVYVGSLTVVGLFVLFRMIQKSN